MGKSTLKGQLAINIDDPDGRIKSDAKSKEKDDLLVTLIVMAGKINFERTVHAGYSIGVRKPLSRRDA